MMIEADKSQDLRLANRKPTGADGVVPAWKPAGLRPRKSQCFQFRGKEKNLSPFNSQAAGIPFESGLLFYSGLCLIGQGSPILGRAICFLQSIDSNANLIWKHPHRHAQSNGPPHNRAPHGPVKLMHKINHHRRGYQMSIYSFQDFQKTCNLFVTELYQLDNMTYLYQWIKWNGCLYNPGPSSSKPGHGDMTELGMSISEFKHNALPPLMN